MIGKNRELVYYRNSKCSVTLQIIGGMNIHIYVPYTQWVVIIMFQLYFIHNIKEKEFENIYLSHPSVLPGYLKTSEEPNALHLIVFLLCMSHMHIRVANLRRYKRVRACSIVQVRSHVWRPLSGCPEASVKRSTKQ